MRIGPRLPHLLRWAALVGVCHLGLALATPWYADAFCGFYVSGGDAKLYNNATVVVQMRDGTRTVLSMQNNYQGPPEDFALVVPVPVILKEQDVKTLPSEGADGVLRPYVQQGMKFFVAKVDMAKVKRTANGQIMLSPLRFHYDSESFSLPVRLGLLNAQGKQDLIVHVLARHTRYELANYKNLVIPTNLEVNDATRTNFAGFYAALFDGVLADNPSAVVTEYAWSAGSCDPCPQMPLNLEELVALGADVLPTYAQALRGKTIDSSLVSTVPSEFVLTRLHARYGRENLGEDLVFQAASAIEGGRELTSDGQLEQGVRPGSTNNFQARYIIRHPWAGPVTCENPRRGIWGDPPANVAGGSLSVARDLAFVARDTPLQSFFTGGVPGLGSAGSLPSTPISPPAPDPLPPRAQDCARCDLSDGTGTLTALGGLALFALTRHRRRG